MDKIGSKLANSAGAGMKGCSKVMGFYAVKRFGL